MAKFRSLLPGADGVLLSLAVLLGSTLAPAGADAQSGLQISPDGMRVMVSKDVGSQRWAITLNADDGTVTGNVFAADGGPPSFVWCSEAGREEGSIRFSCSGADPCPLAPCPTADEWSFIAEASLPASFFEPRQEAPAAGAASTAPRGLARGQGGVAGRSSGVQPSVDGKRILLSKDVGDQRWVIVWNEDDGTLTGNVFFPGGGDPQFVWCLERGRDGGQIEFTCHGADRCTAPPCTRDEWTKIADVLLPESFIEPSSELTSKDLADAVADLLGSQDAGFRATLLAVDRGYTLRQIARAALSGRLDADGRIRSKQGGDETPQRNPTNAFTGTAATAGLERTAEESELIQILCDTVAANASPAQKIEILARLLNAGYTAEQLIRIARGEASLSICDGAPTPAEFEDCVRANGGRSIVLVDAGGPVDPGDPTEDDVLVPEPRRGCNRDGVRQPGEDCDGRDLGNQTCRSLPGRPWIGGELRCDDQCFFDESLCRRESECGDGVRDFGEVCDGTDLGGATCENLGTFYRGDLFFTGGVLRCSNNPQGPCDFIFDDCLEEPVCGNGRIERGEQCDLGQLRGATCTNIGNFFDPEDDIPEFIGGQIGCRTGPGESCAFDLSNCRRPGNTECGDGERDPEEECDIGDFGDRTCVTEGFAGGELECLVPTDGGPCRIGTNLCRSGSFCGDGVRDPGEECDSDDFGGKTCQSEGFVSGELGCFHPSDPTQPCRILFDQCNDRPVCNNGVAEGDLEDEECDQRDFRGETCASLGLGDPRGILECNPSSCRIDRDRSCKQAQECLNDVAEGDEECDRQDLRGMDCTDVGFDFGTLKCGNDCAFDTSECERGCGQGDQTCPDGSCVPLGADCCGNGNFCNPGTVCAGQGSCCPDTLPNLCGSGCIPQGADCCSSSGNWCDVGTVCSGEGCCPPEFPQPCGGNCIRAEAVCCGSSGCAPGSSCCGNQCLPPGQICCGGTNPCSGGTCCGAACVPVGSDCCSPGIACAPGMTCTSIPGVCCPTSLPKPCASDMTCRPAGSPCP